jgi:MFS family permease
MRKTEIPRISRPRGYFARRSIPRAELPVIMRKHIFTGALGTMWSSIVTGIVYIYFGNAIGMSQFQWGVLGGIGAWVVAVQPLGALLGERIGSRKLVWFWFALADRLLRFGGIIAAYVLWRAGHPLAYLVLISAVCVGSLMGNVATPPWYGWFATIIPQQVQGTFWGKRDSWISLGVIAVVLPSGLLMDLIPAQGKLEMAVVILTAAGVLGVADILVHGTIPEQPTPRGPRDSGLSNILTPLRDRRFRPWLLFTAAWNFSLFLGGALGTLYFMENLGFKNNLLGGMISINVVTLLGTLLAGRKVGRMVDRHGIQRMLMLGHLFWSLLPAIWLLATPRTAVFWIGISSVVGGIFPAAANNAATKLVTRFPPAEQTGMYMGVSSMIGNICGGFGALAAGAFLDLMGPWSLSLGRLSVSAFPVLFIASSIMRLATTVALVPRIREKGAVPLDRRQLLLPLFFGLPIVGRRLRVSESVAGEAAKSSEETPGGSPDEE